MLICKYCNVQIRQPKSRTQSFCSFECLNRNKIRKANQEWAKKPPENQKSRKDLQHIRYSDYKKGKIFHLERFKVFRG